MWQRRTHSYNSEDIKPILDSDIWFGKSIREIENIALHHNHLTIIKAKKGEKDPSLLHET